jgi:hypothetical protein
MPSLRAASRVPEHGLNWILRWITFNTMLLSRIQNILLNRQFNTPILNTLGDAEDEQDSRT